MKRILVFSVLAVGIARVSVGCSSSDDSSAALQPDASTPSHDSSTPSDDDSSTPSTDSGQDSGTDAGSLSFATAVYDGIIATHCLSCHGTDGGIGIKFGSLDMTTGDVAYASLVGDGGGVPAGGVGCGALGAAGLERVKPGDPINSLIYNKVASSDGDGGSLLLADGGPELFCGHPMPEQAPALSAAELATISQWITEGAHP